MIEEYKKLVSGYIRAKDENKPHLMENVFSESATLKMQVHTTNIFFPSHLVGLADITNVLVTEFNNSYEDVYTICLSDTVRESKNKLKCRWLVGMTEKVSGSFRVGCGEYQWRFEKDGLCLADHLTIVINYMIVLLEETKPEVMCWFHQLPYPWAVSTDVLASMPDTPLLSEFRGNIA